LVRVVDMSDRVKPSPNHPSFGRRARSGEAAQSLSISCDHCVMQSTAACDDCVVTFVLRADDPAEPLELDAAEERAVKLLAKAGMIPDLRYRVAV
jgi:hypothetical protein